MLDGDLVPWEHGSAVTHRAIGLNIPDLNCESSLWTDLAAFFAVSMMIEVVVEVICLRVVVV